MYMREAEDSFRYSFPQISHCVLDFSARTWYIFQRYFTRTFFRIQEFPMKDKNMLGFIAIDILLAVGVIWGLAMGYKLLGYGLLVYFIINTLALVLKLTGNRKDNNGDGSDSGGDNEKK